MTRPDDILLVLTNLPDRAAALTLANALIETKAAACVNVLAACTSVYHWQGKVENADEIPLLIKTTTAAYPALEDTIVIVNEFGEIGLDHLFIETRDDGMILMASDACAAPSAATCRARCATRRGASPATASAGSTGW